MPLPVPIPPSPDASKAILEAFAERGIEWHPSHVVRGLDPARKVACFDDGMEMPFDLFLGVPVHRVPEVVADSGMRADGWIPVDPFTLSTKWPGVYAVGDVTSVGTPKAGVFAEGQASVVAGEIIALVRGGSARRYEGRGVCYPEFGNEGVAVVDVTFVAGQAPFGFLNGPLSSSAPRSRPSARHGSNAGSATSGDPNRDVTASRGRATQVLRSLAPAERDQPSTESCGGVSSGGTRRSSRALIEAVTSSMDPVASIRTRMSRPS